MHSLRGQIRSSDMITVRANVLQSLLLVLQALAHLGNDVFSDTIIAVCDSLGVSSVRLEARFMLTH